MNKEQIPTAPPSYSESVNAPKYMVDPQSFGQNSNQYLPPMGQPQQQPTHVIVVQAPASKYLKCNCEAIAIANTYS